MQQRQGVLTLRAASDGASGVQGAGCTPSRKARSGQRGHGEVLETRRIDEARVMLMDVRCGERLQRLQRAPLCNTK